MMAEMGFMMVACRVVIAASALAVSVAAQAQQSSTSSSRLMFDPTGMQDVRRPQTQTQTTPQQQPQQTTTGQSAPKPQPATAQPVRQTFTPPPQQTAAPKPAPRRPAPTLASEPTDPNRSAERPIPREQTTLGRVSLPQGSLGYENRTQMQSYDLSDGRRVPAYENIQRKDSSYFGLSLRLPTGSPSSPGSSPSFGSSPSYGSSSFDRHGAN